MDFIPRDYTGRGPTGTGHRPTDSERRRQGENKYRSDRNAEMMMYQDPGVQEAMRRAEQQQISAGNDPARVRAEMNGVKGQAIRDAYFAMRRNGVGYGDPVNYSHNITRGVTSGGFTADIIGKDPSGRSALGLNQHVSGNGLLSERVAQNVQKVLLSELYGKDQSTNPNKTNGFDMEEVSAVAGTLMRRGGLGKAMTLVRGADAQTRIDSARDAAIPELRDKLTGVHVGTGDAGQKELERLAETTKDPKLKAEYERLAKSTDAPIMNDGAAKRLAGVVKEVTKGMAVIGDMYGDLSATELHQTLESITGKQIVNKQQAKAATGMVSSLANSAERAGIDPKVFMELVQRNQATFNQQYTQATGQDERTDTYAKGTVAGMNAEHHTEALETARRSREAVTWGQENGFNTDGIVKTEIEVAKDLRDQAIRNIELSKGEAMVRGRIDQIQSPERRKEAEALLAKKDATTDDSDRSDIEAKLKAFATKEWDSKGVGFEGLAQERISKVGMNKGFADPNAIRAAAAAAFALQGDATIANAAKGLGIDDAAAKDLQSKLLTNVGADGLQQLTAVSDTKGKDVTPETRKAAAMQVLKVSQLSEDDQIKMYDTLFNKDGQLKDKKITGDMWTALGQTTYSGKAAYTKQLDYSRALAERGDNGARKKLDPEGGKLSWQNIITGVVEGKVKADDDETQTLALVAMKEAGMSNLKTEVTDKDGKTSTVDLMDGLETEIDLRGGMSEKATEALTKANGGDLGLLAKFGFKDNADMANKTKNNDELMTNVLKHIQENSNLNLSGGLDNTTAIHDDTLSAAKTSTNSTAKLLKMDAGYRLLNPGMDPNKDTAVSSAIKRGDVATAEKLMKQEFSPDKVATSEGWVTSAGRNTGWMDNNRKFLNAADSLKNGGPEALKNVQELNKDGDFAKAIEAQIAALEQSKTDGLKNIRSRDNLNGGDNAVDGVKESIDKLKALLVKLKGGGEGEGTKTIQVMHVGEMHVGEKKDSNENKKGI